MNVKETKKSIIQAGHEAVKELKDIHKEDLVGFTPSSEYEFIVDGERLYRVPTNSISIKYERQGTETEYNPSWL
jgi:hypothetical protein